MLAQCNLSPDCPDTYVVRNGDGTQHYLVSTRTGSRRCTCPDYQHHGQPLGLPCKHIMAAQIIDSLPKGVAP